MKSSLSRLPEFAQEWRVNLRLRYGVYALVAILWLYGILVLRDAAIARRIAWQAAEARISRAKVLAASGDWSARSNEVKATLADYQGMLWKEGSIGLAQATIQEVINRGLSAAGLSARQVRVSAAEAGLSPELADVIQVRARVTFDLRQEGLYSWLASLSRELVARRPALVVDSMSIRGAPIPLVDVELVALVLKSPENSLAKDRK